MFRSYKQAGLWAVYGNCSIRVGRVSLAYLLLEKRGRPLEMTQAIKIFLRSISRRVSPSFFLTDRDAGQLRAIAEVFPRGRPTAVLLSCCSSNRKEVKKPKNLSLFVGSSRYWKRDWWNWKAATTKLTSIVTANRRAPWKIQKIIFIRQPSWRPSTVPILSKVLFQLYMVNDIGPVSQMNSRAGRGFRTFCATDCSDWYNHEQPCFLNLSGKFIFKPRPEYTT
jgi:hypothetical protein